MKVKALLVAAALLLVGCGSPATTITTPRAVEEGTLNQLNSLPVKGRAPLTDYDRDEFGRAWQDIDHNGCDTRNDILKRDLLDETFKPGTHECVVLTGKLIDPYTGKDIKFQRGQDTSILVQIDHVVALADAWQTGAATWSLEKRANFANDPQNLLAVDGAANQQKGAGDAATWLPPSVVYRCSYATTQVHVKVAYGLWVKPAEKQALIKILETCG